VNIFVVGGKTGIVGDGVGVGVIFVLFLPYNNVLKLLIVIPFLILSVSPSK
jgi:hypothetical protein